MHVVERAVSYPDRYPALFKRGQGASAENPALGICVLATSREIREVTGARHDWRARYCDQFGLWLSLVERLVRDQEAVGSNPTSPIIFLRSGDALRLFPHFFLM
jgi:hypothetical protein